MPHTDWHLLIFIVGLKPLKFSTYLPWGLCGIFLLKLFSFLAYNSLDKGDERKVAEGLARFGSGFGTARRAALTEAMNLPLPWVCVPAAGVGPDEAWGLFSSASSLGSHKGSFDGSLQRRLQNKKFTGESFSA